MKTNSTGNLGRARWRPHRPLIALLCTVMVDALAVATVWVVLN
ncbi:MAG: hypothetical protein ABW352_11660 [Polyangiales bacterium]